MGGFGVGEKPDCCDLCLMSVFGVFNDLCPIFGEFGP